MGQDKAAQLFGAYRIERSFGSGFGVFLARPAASPESSFVVLKRRPSLGLKVDRVPFLTIPEVAEVRDAGRVSDWLYVAMERIPGRDLFSVWNRCAEKRIAIPPDVAVAIMMGVLAGLRNAHREGVAHGNLWPGKVMLTPMGRVILTEFMLSRSLIGALAMTNPRLTSFRAGYGPRPASNTPEADDILLAGRMLWELLAGRPISSGSAAYEEPAASGFGADRPSQHNPEIPPSLDDIALRALSTDPRAGFASAQDFQSALGGAAGLTSSRELIATFLRRLYEENELTGALAATPGSPSGGVQAGPIAGGTKVLPEARRVEPIPIRAVQPRVSKPAAPSFAPSTTEPAQPRSVGRIAMVAAAIAVLGAGGALAYVWQTRRGPEPAATLAEGERVEPARSAKTPEPPPTVSQPTLKADPGGHPEPDPRHGDPPQVPKAVEPPPATEQPVGPSQHRIAHDVHERPDRHARSHAPASGSSFTDQGQAAFDHGDFTGALSFARRAVRAHEGAAAYILMGDAEIKRGDQKGAGQAYRAALRLDPRSEVAKIGLEAASKPR